MYWPSLWLVFGSRPLLLSCTAVAGAAGAGVDESSGGRIELRLLFGVIEMESSSRSSLSIAADMVDVGHVGDSWSGGMKGERELSEN